MIYEEWRPTMELKLVNSRLQQCFTRKTIEYREYGGKERRCEGYENEWRDVDSDGDQTMTQNTPKTMNAKVYSLSDVCMFLGWVCVEIPELHSLECPKLLEAWYKWCAKMGIPSAADGEAKP